ncbi:MAG: hypothetical protein GC161_13930 [Planctomycetaceae bacterium]|nr:hypothetical protein [Planctomycetaceae bacterium]
MKLLSLAAVAALAATLFLVPFHTPANGRSADEGPLAEAMEGLQGGMRTLGRLVGDPAKHAEAMEPVRAMQGHVLTAFAHPPEAPEGEDAARYALAFRNQLHSVLGELLALEGALFDGDADAAKQRFGNLNGLKKAGHDRFKVD